MTIVRVQKKRHSYVTVDKTPFLDNRLTWQARGVLIYLLCKPNDWKVHIKDLMNQSPDVKGQGKNAIQSVLKELEEHGYILRRRVQDPKTKHFTGWETIVFETPEDRAQWELDADGGMNPKSGKADDGLNPSSESADGRLNRKSVEPTMATTGHLINKEDLLSKEDQLINEGTKGQRDEKKPTPQPERKHSSGIARFEQQFSDDPLDPWVLSRRGVNLEYLPEFLEVVKAHLKTTPAYEKKEPNNFNAKQWLNKGYSPKTEDAESRMIDIWALWESHQDDQKPKPQPPQYKPGPLPWERDPEQYKAEMDALAMARKGGKAS